MRNSSSQVYRKFQNQAVDNNAVNNFQNHQVDLVLQNLIRGYSNHPAPYAQSNQFVNYQAEQTHNAKNMAPFLQSTKFFNPYSGQAAHQHINNPYVYACPQYFSSVTFFQTSQIKQNNQPSEKAASNQSQIPQLDHSSHQISQIPQMIPLMVSMVIGPFFPNLSQSQQVFQSNQVAKANDELNKVHQNLMQSLICPISLQLMKNPVIITTCGHTFDRDPIQTWLKVNKRCPLCLKPTKKKHLVRNFHLEQLITRYQNIRFATSHTDGN